MTPLGWATTSEEAAQALSSIIKNKIVLVTGATKGGIGCEAARAIALEGAAEVIISGRSLEKLVIAEELIKAEAPEVKIRKLVADLGSFATVRKGAAELNSWPDLPKIDVLINNAGIMATPFKLTEDGIESQFATNHLGHFLLTALLIKKLIAAGPGSRIVNVSSDGHRRSNVRLDDWNFEREEYQPLSGYGQSKTANMLFTLELAKRLKSKGIQAFSLQPGVILTNLSRHISTEEMVERGWVNKDRQPINSDIVKWKTLSQGAATTIVAAFDPSIAVHSGAYLRDCEIVEPLAAWAKDPEAAEKLWALSEELVGETFHAS